MFKKITTLTIALGMTIGFTTDYTKVTAQATGVQQYEIAHIDEEKFVGISEDINDNVVIYFEGDSESLRNKIEHGKIIEVTYGQAHDDIVDVKIDDTKEAYEISDKAGIEL
ncbi:hypothetical protein [Bacillus cereus]|uniref:Uncharacterized protein n=1 Tax=Bacillus cereus TIAC219 TaxID=718222 RepID=A0ABC9SQG0_BACCE|nr:hypothetical protein [Bacillus cereus]EJP81131.1 hypothetical protein IC1_06619 [Bacillus cereus VD022]EOQ57840.1 hypothetical protein IAY_06246 [Bacillus cereus TIAC219]